MTTKNTVTSKTLLSSEEIALHVEGKTKQRAMFELYDMGYSVAEVWKMLQYAHINQYQHAYGAHSAWKTKNFKKYTEQLEKEVEQLRRELEELKKS